MAKGGKRVLLVFIIHSYCRSPVVQQCSRASCAWKLLHLLILHKKQLNVVLYLLLEWWNWIIIVLEWPLTQIHSSKCRALFSLVLSYAIVPCDICDNKTHIFYSILMTLSVKSKAIPLFNSTIPFHWFQTAKMGPVNLIGQMRLLLSMGSGHSPGLLHLQFFDHFTTQTAAGGCLVRVNWTLKPPDSQQVIG